MLKVMLSGVEGHPMGGGVIVTRPNEAAASLPSAHRRAWVEKGLPEGSENAGAFAKRGAAPD